MELHKHKCPCGFIWEHDPKTFKSEEEHEEAHKCKKCGTRVTWWYEGPDGPTPDMLTEFRQWIDDLIEQIKNKGIAA